MTFSARFTPVRMVTSLFLRPPLLEFWDSEQGRLETVDRTLKTVDRRLETVGRNQALPGRVPDPAVIDVGQEHKWG